MEWKWDERVFVDFWFNWCVRCCGDPMSGGALYKVENHNKQTQQTKKRKKQTNMQQQKRGDQVSGRALHKVVKISEEAKWTAICVS